MYEIKFHGIETHIQSQIFRRDHRIILYGINMYGWVFMIPMIPKMPVIPTMPLITTISITCISFICWLCCIEIVFIYFPISDTLVPLLRYRLSLMFVGVTAIWENKVNMPWIKTLCQSKMKYASYWRETWSKDVICQLVFYLKEGSEQLQLWYTVCKSKLITIWYKTNHFQNQSSKGTGINNTI